jgi:cathepsin B
MKHTKKPKNWTTQYYIAGGISVGSVFIAMVIMMVNPDKGPFQTAVNDAGLIAQLNRNAKSWAAGASSFFEGWTIGDVKLLEGVGVSNMGGAVSNCVVPDVAVPDSFDSREKWAQCFNSPIYNMGNCTASWAIATASVLSNRFCISSPSEHSEVMLSPQQLLSCDNQNRGCNGGDIDTAWSFTEREGLVSEICFPYQADGSVSCHSRCTNEAPMKAASHCVLNTELAIRKEIFTNGPVVAPIFLMDDFLVYKSGVYAESATAMALSDARRQRILHAVKIVGWGKAEGKNYWLIENSWGEDWGEHGYAKVLRGGDPEKKEGIVVETYVIAATPASAAAAEEDDFEADVDLEDVDIDDLDNDDSAAAGKESNEAEEEF